MVVLVSLLSILFQLLLEVSDEGFELLLVK
jgi:hypothetical protein